MKKNEVKVGGTYLAKVTDKVVPVRLDAENPRGGWDGTNLATNKKVRIKSAQRLRGEANKKTKAAVAHDKKGKGPAKAETKKADTKKADGQPKPKRVSALDAAAQVLAKAGKPMRAQELIAAMAEQNLWSSPNGKTPHATLYAAMMRETRDKGDAARFRKVDRGQFVFAGKEK